MCKDVYVFAEQRDGNLQKVGIELIGEARKLADDLGPVSYTHLTLPTIA